MEPENENNIVNRIPHEIITKILSYLPATYRKQARLVCSKWYEASNDTRILKRQQFILPDDYTMHMNSMVSMLHTLRKSCINYYNLVFQFGWVTNYKSFNVQINLFIETHGSMIHSLCFSGFSISFETLEQIIIKCTNLEELIFICGSRLLYDSNHSFLRIPIVDGVEIKREKLKILKFMSCDFVTEELLTKFIAVYPKVKGLALSGKNFVKYNEGNDQNTILYHNFHRIVSRECRNIEKLDLSHSSFDLTDDDLTTLANASCFKLKELNLSHQQSITIKGFKNFLSQQRNLISVTVRQSLELDFQCFNLLLDQNPNLEYVDFELYNDKDNPISGAELINALQKSRLKSFKCDNTATILLNQPISNENQHTLKQLTFCFSFCGRDEVRSELLGRFLKMFCNLTYLDLSGYAIWDKSAGRKISSYIFQRMIHLEVVILYWFDGCDSWIYDDSFVHSDTGRLENLRRLELTNCIHLSENSIENFYYPKLTYLNLSGCININSHESFAQLVETSPLIEELVLTDMNVRQKTVMIICQKLKYLRRLYIGVADDVEGLDTCSFYNKISSSLRYVKVLLKLQDGYECYYFNYNHQTNCLVEPTFPSLEEVAAFEKQVEPGEPQLQVFGPEPEPGTR